MRTIFVPWWPGNMSETPLEAALAVARRVEAHPDMVFVQPEPAQHIGIRAMHRQLAADEASAGAAPL